MKRWLWLVVVGVAAVAVAAFAWSRAIDFDRATAQRELQWQYSDGTPFPPGREVAEYSFEDGLLLGKRAIARVRERGGDYSSKEQGFGYVEPSSGHAKLAWPVDTGKEQSHFKRLAVAVRDEQTFAIAYFVMNKKWHERSYSLFVGIAGPEGWLRAPTEVPVSWYQPYAMTWVNGAVELAVTAPAYLTLGGSKDAVSAAPQIIRVPVTGKVETRPLLYTCEGCQLLDVNHDDKDGWRALVWRGEDPSKHLTAFMSASGQRPGPALEFVARGTADATSHGIVDSAGFAQKRTEPDGSLTDVPELVPGWESFSVGEMVWMRNGQLRAHRRSSMQYGTRLVLADEVATGVVYSGHLNGVFLVGASPYTLAPVSHSYFDSDALYGGVFIPRVEGGYYAVSIKGAYITLDANLRRVDGRTLREHLREPRWNSAPDFEAWFAWALFGLPIMALVGFALVRVARWGHGALTFTLFVYVVSGAVALSKVLDLV